MFADTTFARACRRLIATLAAALVLALTVLVASPQAHEHVHHGCHHDESHACAVVLFAQGIWTPFELPLVAAPGHDWVEFIPHVRPELRLVTPRYLRQPERGPPVG